MMIKPQNFYQTHIIDMYHKMAARLQRHISLGRFHTLSNAKQTFLLNKVNKLEAKLNSFGYKTQMAGAALSVVAAVQTIPAVAQIAPEYQVNTYTSSDQENPKIAADAMGNYVIVWESFEQDGDGKGIYAQRFNKNGVTVGGEFLVNTSTTSSQTNPEVAMDADGDFVITWQSPHENANFSRIYAQRYNSSGTTVGGEFLVNSYSSYTQINPSIAMDADGDFVIAWQSNNQDGNYNGIYAQRYNNSGVTVGGEFLVNTYTTYDQKNPSVAMNADGDFVITWESYGQDSQDLGIYAQKFNNSGVPVGGEFQVNTYVSYAQYEPKIAMDADGDFVITWRGDSQDGSGSGVYAQRFNNAGTTVGVEFLVNTHTTSYQDSPSIAMDADGDFIVTWKSYYQDGKYEGVYAQRYLNDGSKQGTEFRVNTQITYSQNNPSVAMDSNGDFVIAWVNFYGQNDENRGIRASNAPDNITIYNANYKLFENNTSAIDIGALQVFSPGNETALNYTIVGGNAQNLFSIDPTNGVVSVVGMLNYETSQQHVLTVQVSLANNTTVKATAQMTINVIDKIESAKITLAGNEFQVNTFTFNNQNRSKIASDSVGNYVVVWESNGNQDGDKRGVFAQRYDKNGTTIGGEFLVNTYQIIINKIHQ